MKFKINDTISWSRIVSHPQDTATFEGENVHPVYATFAVARDAEWTTRQFVLQMKTDEEEGIGTFVQVEHVAPALVGEKVIFEAAIYELNKNIINCSFQAKVGERVIATGKTGQKIIPKEKLKKYFETFSAE